MRHEARGVRFRHALAFLVILAGLSREGRASEVFAGSSETVSSVARAPVLADVLCPGRPSLRAASQALKEGAPSRPSLQDDREFYLAALFAGLAYDPRHAAQDLEAAGWSHFVEISGGASGFSGFLVSDGQRATLAVAGTADVFDVLADLSFLPVAESSGRIPGKVHSGFQTQLDSVWPYLLKTLESPEYRNKPLTIVGHSLGAALALMTAARLSVYGVPTDQVFALGGPRVGDQVYGDWFDAEVGEVLGNRLRQFFKGNDVIPRVPPDFRDAQVFGNLFPEPAASDLAGLVGQFRYVHFGRRWQVVSLERRAVEWSLNSVGDAGLQVGDAPLQVGDAPYWQWIKTQVTQQHPLRAVLSGVQMGLDHFVDQFVCYGANMIESNAGL